MKKCKSKNCKNTIIFGTWKYGSGLCRSCAAKKRLKDPKNHPSYKDGRSLIQYYCIEENCNQKVTKKDNRCNNCENKRRLKEGIYKGKNNPNYKGDKAKCRQIYYCKSGCNKQVKSEGNCCISCCKIGKIKIKREIRYCACGCGYLKEVKITSKWKWKNGHQARNIPKSEKVKKLISTNRKKFNQTKKGKKIIKKSILKRKNTYKLYGLGRLENNPNWQGGKSFEPYPLGWTKTFKEQIRYRDSYKCQLCGCHEVECKRKLHVHHIDYNKSNLDVNNLISLCNSCHSKTNSSNREYWENLLLQVKMKV